MKILKELREKGIKIKVVGNDKLWLGPKEKVNSELIAKIRQHKKELIKALMQYDPRHICQDCIHLRENGYCPIWGQNSNEFMPIFWCPYFKTKETLH